MLIKFLGSGDAFGSGGRFNTCFLVKSQVSTFLIDCGSSSMIAMRHFGVDPNQIDTIVISHLHGDHFGGLPYFILDAQLVSRRTRPLVMAGPPGFKARLMDMMEACFPGSSKIDRKFSVEIIELQVPGPTSLGELAILTARVVHPSGDTPSLALRIEVEDKIIAYTGDTEWVEELVGIGRSADLLIAEAYYFDKKVRYHLDLATLREQLPRMRPKRFIVTHMSTDMLNRASALDCECATDGLEVAI
jgi:ribonuclease BN (tRNA processing enzyme)